jgi:hypothetical protein
VPVPLTLSVIDREVSQGPDSLIECSIDPGFGSNLFNTSLQSGCTEIHVTDVIDVDEHPEYEHIELVVRAVDSYLATAFTLVNLTIFNINDYWPQFSPSTYSATINGNLYHSYTL